MFAMPAPRPQPPCRLDEAARTQLIGQIAALLRSEQVPDETRQAGLTLIGWLARRMPQDRPPA